MEHYICIYMNISELFVLFYDFSLVLSKEPQWIVAKHVFDNLLCMNLLKISDRMQKNTWGVRRKSEKVAFGEKCELFPSFHLALDFIFLKNAHSSKSKMLWIQVFYIFFISCAFPFQEIFDFWNLGQYVKSGSTIYTYIFLLGNSKIVLFFQ